MNNYITEAKAERLHVFETRPYECQCGKAYIAVWLDDYGSEQEAIVCDNCTDYFNQDNKLK